MDAQTDHLETMVHAYWRELSCMLTAIVGNSATAEDLTQEVFMLAVKEDIQPGAGVRTWLHRAARFLALNELRRKRPMPLSPVDIERVCDTSTDFAVDGENADFEEALAALRLCKSELKETDRHLLTARYERRESLETIAVLEQQTVGYLKQRLFRLRLRLRACVKRRLDRGDENENEPGNVETDPVPV
jgi:RNA polymerase sigma-70 factor (ECF subfamily)